MHRCGRCHIDDTASSLSEHVGSDRLYAPVDRVDSDRHLAPVDILLHLGHRLVFDPNGVVHQHIDPAEMGRDVIDALLPCCTIGHVHHARQHLGPSGADRSGRLTETRCVCIDQRQPRTCMPGLFGHRPADAASRACHDDRFVFQCFHSSLL